MNSTNGSDETMARRAIALLIVVFIALSAAALLASMTARSVGASHRTSVDEGACRAAAANDEHASLEAFFANPPQENALAQIRARCSTQAQEHAQ